MSSFLYSFQVPDSGTYFWHAHSGVQRADGVYGALIIRDHEDPHARLYDYDLAEHVIIVNDWFHVPAMTYKPDHLRPVIDQVSPSVLINGRGRFHSNALNTSTPLATFSVTRGFRYRFRVISNGVKDCPIVISIDNHNLTLIASDGEPFQPITVQAFTIFAGERYDFVLEAKQPVDNYWFRAIGYIECWFGSAYQLATLRYKGAPELEPQTPVVYDQEPFAFAVDIPPLAALKRLTKPSEDISGVPDVKRYLAMGFKTIDWTLVDGVKRPADVSNTWAAMITQINHISLEPPPVPVLYQYKEIPKDVFCDEDTVRDRNCSTTLCSCTYVIDVKLGQLVELILTDEGPVGFHPLHLHGYSFYVVGVKKLDENTTGEDVRKADEAGQIERNLLDPIQKDTILVTQHGYTILRFRANNPGFWFLHCHLDMHVEMGMGLFIKVGEPEEWPAEPANWQHCGGDFVAKAADVVPPSVSSAPATVSDHHIGAIIGGVLGSVAVLALIAGVVAMVVMKQASSARMMAHSQENPFVYSTSSNAVGQPTLRGISI